MSPMDCLKLLLHYTPAQELLTHVRFILDDVSMVTGLGSPRFLQVLQRAKGLREVDIMIDMEMIPLVMYYLHRSMRKLEGELKHVRNITLGDKGPDKHPEAHEAITLLAASLLERNKQWAELSGNSDAVTKEMNKTDAVKKEIGKSDEVTKEEDKSDAVTKEIDESDKGTLAATSCQDGSNGEA